jgi:chemotaxis protein histidine kinase CheA
MSEDDRWQQQVADIGTRYLKRTIDELPQLRECLYSLRGGGSDALKQLERMAHKIHGSGAMFGFDEVGARACDIERLAAAGHNDPNTVQRIEASLALLEEQVGKEAHARGIR